MASWTAQQVATTLVQAPADDPVEIPSDREVAPSSITITDRPDPPLQL